MTTSSFLRTTCFEYINTHLETYTKKHREREREEREREEREKR